MPGALPCILMAAAVLPTSASMASASMAALSRDESSQQTEGSELSLLQTRASVRADRREAAGGKQYPNPGDPHMPLLRMQVEALESLKHNPLDMEIVNSTLPTLATTATWYLVQERGYDAIFRALRDFAHEPSVQMSAWRGLSDQSWTELGAQHIANYGGPNKGIEYMVQQLAAHPEAKTALCEDHLTYQYEVLQCIGGLLSSDINGTRGAAAVDAGLLEAAVHAMRVEPDLRPTQHAGCSALTLLLYNSAVNHERDARLYAQRLRDLGVIEILEHDLATYSSVDDTPFYFGTTYGEIYPLIDRCQYVLNYLNFTA